MSAISLQRVSKVFNRRVVAVDELDLEIGTGELMVLLGPSGCGKSTVLRMIAGLEAPTSGQILLDGEDAAEIPIRERGVSMVFQDYALYPHMSVRDNVGFPLKLRRTPTDETQSRVTAMATHLGIDELLDRGPDKLSGGQRQRVAMARAMIRRPSLFLLDEPLSNVDSLLRSRLRAEIAEMVRASAVTTVYVTHDQVEALSMADRIAVLRNGVLQHVGTPEEVYHRPGTAYVAAFVGSPRMNLLPAYVGVQADTRVLLHLGDRHSGPCLDLPWSDPRSRVLAHYHGETITMGVRADAITLADRVAAPGRYQTLPGWVRFVEHLGHESIGYVDIGADQLVVDQAAEAGVDRQPMSEIAVRLPAHEPLAAGRQIELAVAMEQLHFFERNGQRIAFRIT